MIYDLRGSLAHIPILLNMQDSAIEFFQTGSRYMGGYRLDSDWDFMTQFSEHTQDFLKSLGFSIHVDSNYCVGLDGDNLTVEVWEVDYGDTTIQVQLSRDVHLNRRVRDVIWRDTPLFNAHLKMDRRGRVGVWSGLARILGS